MKIILNDMNNISMKKMNPNPITIVRYFEEIVVQNVAGFKSDMVLPNLVIFYLKLSLKITITFLRKYT